MNSTDCNRPSFLHHSHQELPILGSVQGTDLLINRAPFPGEVARGKTRERETSVSYLQLLEDVEGHVKVIVLDADDS